MFTQDSITVLTSDVIAVHMSQPSDKGLTVTQKADLIQDEIIWSQIPGVPLALNCTSPTSGNVYRVSLNPLTGEVRCNCKSKGHCKHAECFNRDWKSALMPSKPSTYSAPVETRPAVSAATYAADWSN